MGRRRTGSTTSSSSKNPFQGRGMEKFQQVYAELERKRVEIAAREGVPTTDVWFMRDTNEDWVPLVVGKKTKHHGSSRLQLDDRQPELETIQQQDQQQGQFSAAQSSSSSKSSSPCWVWMKLEQILLDMQQAARRALKTISLFIMVVAAVANLVVAVVAELSSSLVSLVAGGKAQEQVPRSNPNPNLVSLVPPSSSTSPPVTPRLRIPPSSGSTSRTSSRPTSPRVVRGPLRRPVAATTRSNATPVLVTVVVILLSMEIGRVASVLVAAISWFTFPALKAMVAAATRR